eukprot:CAMPEP_0118723458 /NCGR_PEP_ID=MMETSP0800-20121206/32013_1 /TAXON_ID=210618 ORGANISM="Striatella unipunctata, Strain CCMP2910" /NCGR_SAMPLE_ID=MMETSP0800 /ASSEMBLY_ACC=CAM_ASM_000638 /LENGTH=102 /DNA_ID=CAMNT_0006631883 /DNA_START=104 /DNA_END=409 /DNA_ORIENTATION=-
MDLLSIDICNTQEKIAIEVQGPMHYVYLLDNNDNNNNDDNNNNNNIGNSYIDERQQIRWYIVGDRDRFVPSGPTVLKERLPQKLGWKVWHIPFWEWEELKRN